MLQTDLPSRFPIPFANAAGGGFIRAIPVGSQIGIVDGAASLTDGFPPLNFSDRGAGGVPPSGKDWNGLQYQITQGLRWIQCGGPAVFNSAQSTAISGYPKGAVLQSTDGITEWVSLVDNNTVDPDAGPSSNWAYNQSFKLSLTGAVLRSINAKLSNMEVDLEDFGAVADWDGVHRSTTHTAANTTAIFNAISNARGRRIKLNGTYTFNNPLIINSVVSGSATPFEMFGNGYDSNGTGVAGCGLVPSDNTQDAIQITNTGGTDTLISLHHFGLYGDGTDATGGMGINVNNCSNVKLSHLWVQGFRSFGVKFFQCFGSSLTDSYIFKNRIFGVYCSQAFNLGNLRNLKCYGNGTTWKQQTAAIRIAGEGNACLGVVLDNIDTSYSGSAVNWYRRSDSTLTSIVVAGGVGTATTATAHGRTTNDVVFITGATVDLNLNSIYPLTITVTGANTFTFPAIAANATYTETTLRIAPAAFGCSFTGIDGLTFTNAYCEEAAATAMYVGGDVTAFDIRGGYHQGGVACGTILLDNPNNGKIAAIQFTGVAPGIIAALVVTPHNVSIESSCTFTSTCLPVYGTIRMVDGRYSSGAMPTTGTWAAGTAIDRFPFAVGSPAGWRRVTTGSSNVLGTDWIAMPNV